MDLNKKVIEIEESFRNGKIDNRIGFQGEILKLLNNG